MENIHIPVVSESAAKVLAATSISQSYHSVWSVSTWKKLQIRISILILN